ncbi:adenylate/guanylate cyclase domain-containing protein [Methylobacterium oryzisoli]|uniref:adenylate/guanylate cyclase domain-containing protein n=1 Tax=Methylobacterium oryzisoli TaxID=3385502 RepID=UPI0038920E76
MLAIYHIYIIVSCALAVPGFTIPFVRQYLFLLVPLFWIPSGIAIAIVMYFAERSFDVYISGVVFTLLYACCAVRMLFVSAVMCCLLQVIFVNVALYARSAGANAFTYTNSVLMYSVAIGLVLNFTIELLARRNFVLRSNLDSERGKLDAILREILPSSILARIRSGERRIADLSAPVTVIFGDIVGFTQLTARQKPEFVVDMLNRLFSTLDELAAKHGVEKIKTVGDAYMAAVGVGDAADKDVFAIAEFALEARDAVSRLSREAGVDVSMRFGFATGSVISGVIGVARPVFDTWGLHVNLASRLEGAAPPNGILVDGQTADVIRSRYIVRDDGPKDLKGIGETPTFLVVGRTDRHLDAAA